jgi:hypothetical protein
MNLFSLNPLLDPRWERFVGRHPRASVFHTRGWLEALHRTYGYEPVAYTTAAPAEELTNGVVFCRIDSWLTGRRLVSLPFSDHCEPLMHSKEEWQFFATSILDDARWDGYKYVEIRPQTMRPELDGLAEMSRGESYFQHSIDLRYELKDIFLTFHKSCVQRKIRRAERERLSYAEGCSPKLVGQFYTLLTATRRRHHLPPQPLRWFNTLIDCLDELPTIRIAYKDDLPIAGTLALSFRNQIYYKYGCSDRRFHNLGGMQMLLWQTIQQGKERGAEILDLGRSDLRQTSLATFKDHWGSTRSLLTYYSYPRASRRDAIRRWATGIARHAFAHLPNSLLATAGKLVYPHMG